MATRLPIIGKSVSNDSHESQQRSFLSRPSPTNNHSSFIIKPSYVFLLPALATMGVTAFPNDMSSLAARDDCGAGGAPDTRRTNNPCSSTNPLNNPDSHAYCTCDRTGFVR